MSTISHKKSKKDFDVLEDQDVQTKEDKNLHHVKLHRVHEKASGEPSIKKAELHVSPFAKVTDFVKEDSTKDEGFKSAMKSVVHYVRGLKDSKGAKVLAFDLSVYDSMRDYEKVLEILSGAVTKGIITKKEESDLVSVLSKVSLDKKEDGDTHAEKADKEVPSVEELDGFVGLEKIKNHSKDSLPEVREEYILEYIKWEQKYTHGKKFYVQAMTELGGSRPLPKRISEKHPELDTAEKEYREVLQRVTSGMTPGEKMEFLVNEKENLGREINSRRDEKAKRIVSIGLKVWDSFQDSGKLPVSEALLSGLISYVSPATVPQSEFSGYRAPRNNPTEGKVSASQTSEDVSQKLAKFLDKQNEKRQNISSLDEKRVGIADEVIPESKNGIFSGLKKVFGLGEHEIASHSIVESVPKVEKTVEVKAQPEKTEVFHLQAGRIPFHNGTIDIVDTGVAKKVLLNNMEIAKEVPFGDHKILCLEDKYQDGSEFAGIRGAFNVAFDNTFALENKAEVIEEVPFEEGKVAILMGISGKSDSICVLLNGKLIATGEITNKGPIVSLIDSPEVKSGWLMADTVYERAFKKAVKVIKGLKRI